MGYRKEDGRWANTLPIAFLGSGGHEKAAVAESGTVSVTGSSAVIEVGDRGTIRLTALIAAVTGTAPTFDITVLTCDTRAGTFRPIGVFPTFTAASTKKESFGGLDRFVRLDYVVGGSASPTFSGSIDGDVC